MNPGKVIWLTGIPRSGKTTIAQTAAALLRQSGIPVVIVDGDQLRQGLSADIGFTAEDRAENVRRAGEMAKLIYENGIIAMVAMISPQQTAREKVRALFPAGDFIEVHCACRIETCKRRDYKGLYSLAENGLIADFTGISSPYEPPVNPELVLDTSAEDEHESSARLLEYLHRARARMP